MTRYKFTNPNPDAELGSCVTNRIYKRKRYTVIFRIFDEYTVDVYATTKSSALTSAVIGFDKQKARMRGSYIRPVKIVSIAKNIFSYP